MTTFLSRFRKSKLAQNTGWMFLGQGLRLLIQAGYFVIIARSLGVQQYGAFAAVTALVAILIPFVGLGSRNLIVQNVARDRELLDECFGNGMLLTLGTGVAAVALVVAICRWLLPPSISLTIVFMVGIGDLVFFCLIVMISYAFVAVERLDRTAQLNVLLSGSRFIGIAATVAVVRHPTAELWSIVYAGTTAIALLVSLFTLKSLVHSFRLAPGRIKKELLEGFYFSGGLAAQTVYNDIDKTMLARFSTLSANGIYSAAYRIVDVSFIPVSSVIYAAYPGYFRHGKGQVQATFDYARRLLPRPIVFSLISFAGLFLTAPLLPKILGGEYLRIVEALRWLAVLPLFKTIHYFFADALSGAGYQGLRMCLQIVVAVFNVLVNLWIIPAYSWRGAAWSSLMSDGLLAVLMWVAINLLRRRQTGTEANLAPLQPAHCGREEESEFLSTPIGE